MKWTLLPLALALVACDSSPPPQTTSSRVFEAQIQAVDKARAVDGQVIDAAEAQRRQIDEATQP